MTDNEIELEIERGLPELERQCRKLSAECERLIDMRHKMAMELSDFVDRKDCVINSQKAEIESFNVELNAMRGAANSYKLENERLLQKLQQAKSDAIWEFAERLKNKIWYHPACNHKMLITSDYIYDLARKMTEEQK